MSSENNGKARCAIAVFTAKNVETILSEGGSGNWVLDPTRARQCEHVVCMRNGHPDEWALAERAPEPHRSAFLIGRIADVVPSPHHEGRWVIEFDRYALIDLPEVWQGWRNPVRYTTLEELGIDLAKLEFQGIPPVERGASEGRHPSGRPTRPQPGRVVPNLTIAEAKQRLAATLGVTEGAIEITIRA